MPTLEGVSLRTELAIVRAAQLAGAKADIINKKTVNGYSAGLWWTAWSLSHQVDAERLVAEVNAMDELAVRHELDEVWGMPFLEQFEVDTTTPACKAPQSYDLYGLRSLVILARCAHLAGVKFDPSNPKAGLKDWWMAHLDDHNRVVAEVNAMDEQAVRQAVSDMTLEHEADWRAGQENRKGCGT